MHYIHYLEMSVKLFFRKYMDIPYDILYRMQKFSTAEKCMNLNRIIKNPEAYGVTSYNQLRMIMAHSAEINFLGYRPWAAMQHMFMLC